MSCHLSSTYSLRWLHHHHWDAKRQPGCFSLCSLCFIMQSFFYLVFQMVVSLRCEEAAWLLLTLLPLSISLPAALQSITTEVASEHLIFYPDQGVLCIGNLDGWSWNNGASPNWAQDWPPGDAPKVAFRLTNDFSMSQCNALQGIIILYMVTYWM